MQVTKRRLPRPYETLKKQKIVAGPLAMDISMKHLLGHSCIQVRSRGVFAKDLCSPLGLGCG